MNVILGTHKSEKEMLPVVVKMERDLQNLLYKWT